MGMGVSVSEKRREAAVTGMGVVVLKCLGLRTTLGVVVEDKQRAWRVDVTMMV